jgi:hypothetical protein
LKANTINNGLEHRSCIRVLWAIAGCLLISAAHGQFLPYSQLDIINSDAGPRVFANADFYGADSFISLKELNNIFKQKFNTDPGGYSPKNGVNHALLKSQLEIGYAQDHAVFSYVFRKDIHLQASSGLVKLAYANKMGAKLPNGTELDMSSDLAGHELQGLKHSRQLFSDSDGINAWRIQGGVSVLYGTQYKLFHSSGLMHVQSGAYIYDGQFTDSNSLSTYPYIRNATPWGLGVSTDLSVQYERHGLGKLSWIVNDAVGQMQWHNMPHSDAILISQKAKFNAYGYLIFDPSVMGTNDLQRRNLKERLAAQNTLITETNILSTTLKIGTQTIWGLQMPFAGISLPVGDSAEMGYQREFNFRSQQLWWKNQHWLIKLLASELPLSQTKTLGLGLQYIWKL